LSALIMDALGVVDGDTTSTDASSSDGEVK
jgi:hypothetical protein